MPSTGGVERDVTTSRASVAGSTLRVIVFRILAAGATLSLLSCELIPVTTVVDVRLPETPEHWRAAWGDAVYEVSWTSAGDVGVADGLHGAGARLSFEIPRTPPVAIVARPKWPSLPAPPDGWPAPAGVLGPDLHQRTLEATFRGGPAAEIVRRLLAGGMDLGDFNLRRLEVEIAERLPDDPWAVNLERVVTAIGSRAMRASYIRAPDRHDTRLHAPAGLWHRFTPFLPPVPGGDPWPDLPDGVTRFVSRRGEVWVVSVDKEGRGWQPAAP